MKNVPHAKAFDFSKKSKVKKRVRRQFVVDGQVGFFRGTMDECLPTPWFIENPQKKKKHWHHQLYINSQLYSMKMILEKTQLCHRLHP